MSDSCGSQTDQCQKHIPRPLAGRASPFERQTDDWRSSPICSCRRNDPAFAGTGAHGWFYSKFSRSHHTRHPHRILGSKTQKNPWSFSPHTGRTRISQSCQSFWATSKKELGHCSFTQRAPRTNSKKHSKNRFFRFMLAETKVYWVLRDSRLIYEQAAGKMVHGIKLCHINQPIYGLLFL